MIFLTHLLGGILAVSYLGGSNGAAVAAAALFSALPDIDMVKSMAGRNLQPFSTILSFVFRHRGFLHTFVFAAAVYFMVLYLSSPAIASAALVGYSSHLLLDALTKEGIMPFAPFSKAKLRGFVKTGCLLEKIILAAMAILLVFRLKFA